MSRWLCFVVFAAALASTPAGAQFVIKQPTLDLPAPPPIVLEEEEELAAEPAEEAAPVYEGHEITLPASCDPDRLQYAGLRCSEERRCDLYLQLSSIASQGQWVVVAGEIHGPNHTYESVLLSSADGGRTWSESAERVVAGGMEAISIVDGQHAFVAGQQGDTATGERPFLLVSDDAGVSWKTRMVKAGESGRGSVIDFQADSPRHGFLTLELIAAAGDRYRLYETYNAGRSWSIRQITAQKPQVPGPRFVGLSEGWRIRPDSPAGQYVLSSEDASQESGWLDQTRFNVVVGTCPPL